MQYSYPSPGGPPGSIIRRRTMVASCWALLLLVGFVAPSQAALRQVPGLYDAEVIVSDQGPAERSRGIAKAFLKVLVKVTGSREIARQPGVAAEARKASRLVRQYHYQRVVAGEDSGEATVTPPGFLLKVGFDAGAVDRLLRQQGLPVWGSTRPVTLLWLSLDNGRSRYLFVADNSPDVRDAIMQASRERGLDLLLPLMDLEDRSALQLGDVWGGFEERIMQASGRYSPDAVVTGRLTAVGKGLWRGQWSLYLGGQVRHWQNQAPTGRAAAAGGVDYVAGLLADRFAPSGPGGGAEWIRVRVSNVHDLDQYARLRGYLLSLNPVDEANLVAVGPTANTWQLRVRGGAEAFERSVGLGNLLEREAAPEPMPIPATSTLARGSELPALQYRLRQ